MLEWVCPQCSRLVDPGLTVCPNCGNPEPAATSAKDARRPSCWADFERGFRFGLGLVTVLAIVYFVLFLAAYLGDHTEWVDRLARWIRLR